MLHKTDFEIFALFTGNYQARLYGRELVGKVSMSQKSIALSLSRLENQGYLKSETKGSIKFYSLNIAVPEIQDILAMTEIYRKMVFIEKYKFLHEIFRQDKRIVGIFGSYARNTNKKDSDIDIFIIGEKKDFNYEDAGKIYDVDLDIKKFTEKDFVELLSKKNPLVSEIVNNHVLIFNIERFISIVWRNYYGFN
ncbi:MAG: nucleotidyltransferase domain-containing protein [Nanoarchaeota archaeon]|nr:nucleotidyltransferase domain-containing protein [Nanoarchaeota archaeon]